MYSPSSSNSSFGDEVDGGILGVEVEDKLKVLGHTVDEQFDLPVRVFISKAAT
jgi:hypothetical protein